jgi:DNA-binding transcriptional LysR family regulator
MFLRQFQYLVALEREGHFGRAAERCNVSQPSLSSAIKSLEEELGVPIILRHQKYQGFTAEGKRVVEWSKRLIADREAMLEELAIMHRNLTGRLRIGAMPMSSPVLPTINDLFTTRYPAVQVDIQFVGLERMKIGLNNFELDVGITYLEDQPLERLRTLSLYEERWSLMVPKGMFPAKKRTVTWKEAADIPLCLLSPSMRERQIMDEAFKKIGCDPTPTLESNSIFQLTFHVMQGNVATVIPANLTHANRAFPGTREIPLESPIIRQSVGLVWERGNPMLPMAKAVVELMEEARDAGAFSYPFNPSLESKARGQKRAAH